MIALRTAAQQALEALEEYQSKGAPFLACDGAVAALRAALAQQAEPLNLRDPAVQKRLATQWGYVPAAQAEPVEPVAWVNQANLASARLTRDRGGQGDTHTWSETRSNYHGVPLYTAPPQRKPLTDEEVRKHLATAKSHEQTWLMFARAIERAHGIKEN